MTTRKKTRAHLSSLLGFVLLGAGCGVQDDPEPIDPITPVSPVATPGGVAPVNPSAVTPGSVTPGAVPPGSVAPGGPSPVAPGACLSTVGADNNLLLSAHESNNYWFTSDFQPRDVVVKPGTDLTFDWTGLTTDFLGHPVNAQAPIDMVLVVKWKLPRAEVIANLNRDELDSEFTQGAVAHFPQGNTTAELLSFKLPTGGEVPLADFEREFAYETSPADQFSFSVMASQGTEPGKGIRAIKTLTLDPASENTTVVIDTAPGDLTFQTDLQTLTPVAVPVGNNAITVDWSTIMTNGLEAEFRKRHISNVLIGRYSLSLEELETQFLDLEYIADGLWQGAVEAGEKFALSNLVDANGVPFAGIDATGTWILALQCKEKCGNPAPWYLTRLVPCAQ